MRRVSSAGRGGNAEELASRNAWLSMMACGPCAAVAVTSDTIAARRRMDRIAEERRTGAAERSAAPETLEEDLDAELHLPRIARARRLPEVAARHEGHDLGPRRIERHRLQVHRIHERLAEEVRPVEHVEDLEPQLYLAAPAGAHRLV